MPTVLFLGANARDTTRLRLGAEVREIRRELQTTGVAETFRIETELSVRPNDLQSLLLEHSPMIVHFSGHGSSPVGGITSDSAATRSDTSREFANSENAPANQPGELLLEDDQGSAVAVRADLLTELLEIIKRDDPLRCVVLNACFSASQAQAIAEHVDCVIGTMREVDDLAAIAFATAFYRAIGHGRNVQSAFDLGRVEVGLRRLPGEDVFRLFHRPEIKPERVFLNETERRQPIQTPRKESHEDLAFGSVKLDRRATYWRRESSRAVGSPFTRSCLFHLQLDPAAKCMYLPFDVTLLNNAPRAALLSQVGVEIVEIVPLFEGLTPAEIARALSRGIPTAKKVEKAEETLMPGQTLLKLLRQHVVKALRQTSTVIDLHARRALVIPVGETAWIDLEDPVYLEPNAPYRLGLIVDEVQQYLPSHFIIRLAARTQLGDSHSGLIEICMAR